MTDLKTKAEEIVLAIRPCINAESYRETLAAIISLVGEQREADAVKLENIHQQPCICTKCQVYAEAAQVIRSSK